MWIRLVVTVVLACMLSIVVTGCGGSSASSTPAGSSKSGGGTSGKTTASLQVHLAHIGSKQGAGVPVPTGIQCSMSIPAICNTTVECPVAEGTKDAGQVAACTWLSTPEAKQVLLEEPADDQACTMQYGGPETAHVTGTLDGKPVDAKLSREDGCAIARFDQAAVLWSGPPPSAPSEVADPPKAFNH